MTDAPEPEPEPLLPSEQEPSSSSDDPPQQQQQPSTPEPHRPAPLLVRPPPGDAAGGDATSSMTQSPASSSACSTAPASPRHSTPPQSPRTTAACERVRGILMAQHAVYEEVVALTNEIASRLGVAELRLTRPAAPSELKACRSQQKACERAIRRLIEEKKEPQLAVALVPSASVPDIRAECCCTPPAAVQAPVPCRACCAEDAAPTPVALARTPGHTRAVSLFDLRTAKAASCVAQATSLLVQQEEQAAAVRQGRRRALLMRLADLISPEDKAALRIQCAWRGHRVRRDFAVIKRMHRTRMHVIKELVETERGYVKDLGAAVSGFLVPMVERIRDMDTPVATLLDIDWLFSEIRGIERLHSLLLVRMDKAMRKLSPTSQFCTIFKHDVVARLVDLYSPYVNNYNHALNLLTKKKQMPEFHSMIAEFEKNPLCRGHDLESLLITPIQRIPRYKMLLTELLKTTWKTHPDYENIQDAIALISKITDVINDRKREADALAARKSVQIHEETAVPALSEDQLDDWAISFSETRSSSSSTFSGASLCDWLCKAIGIQTSSVAVLYGQQMLCRGIIKRIDEKAQKEKKKAEKEREKSGHSGLPSADKPGSRDPTPPHSPSEEASSRMERANSEGHLSVVTFKNSRFSTYLLRLLRIQQRGSLSKAKLWTAPPRPPSIISQQLVDSLLRVMAQCVSPACTVDLCVLAAQHSFKQLVLAFAEVQTISMRGLTTLERRALLLNIYNVAVVVGQAMRGVARSWVAWNALQRDTFVTIGSHKFSLDDITRILAGFPGIVGGADTDVRCLFSMCTGTRSGPQPRVHTAESVEDDVRTDAEHFLDEGITIVARQKTITLPALVVLRRDWFGKTNKRVLEALLPYVSEAKRQQLQAALSEAGFTVTYAEAAWSPMFFRYS
eukprot:m51a1_g7714 putative domain containing protein (907) ;mRNA; f:115882-119449